jgi:hypothetical protein
LDVEYGLFEFFGLNQLKINSLINHRFGLAKFAYGGLIFGSSQFTLLPQLPLKMTPNLKVAKINTKIINLTLLI